MVSKRIIGLLSLVLLFNSCDDGEVTVQTIEFPSTTVVKCGLNDVYYKLNGSEILAVEMPANQNAFINEPTPIGVPRPITLSATNRVVYRSYDGTVALGNICSTIPATSPNVVEEWTATSGRMEVITTAVYTTNPTTNATRIDKYNHNIVFKDISFNKPSGVQVYETFPFGNYQTEASDTPFGFNGDNAQKCPSTNLIYNYSGIEALTLDIAPTLYPNVVGTQTGLISATNKVTYKLFTSALNASYFCTTPTPATPVLDQEWNAVDGVTNVSGIIEVITTTETASTYRHFIHLKNVTFKKGNSTFYLGDDYLYGSFVTP
ncbi:MAG: hypothetical protein V4648_06060 [Bacteroidota bacterium]